MKIWTKFVIDIKEILHPINKAQNTKKPV
jgi:hypothetical protein